MDNQSSNDYCILLFTRVSFGLLAVVAGLQAIVVVNRMRRETSISSVRSLKDGSCGQSRTLQDCCYNYYDRLFLLFSRIGFLIILVGTMIDNIRLLIGSFPISWPQELWDAHPNDSLAANTFWKSINNHHDRRLTPVMAALYWFCIFSHQIPTSLSIYTVSQVLYKSLAQIEHRNSNNKAWCRQQQRRPVGSSRLWFWSTAVLVAILTIVGIYGFCAGPLQGGLYLRAAKSYFMFHAEVDHPIMHGLLTVVLWQCMMIAVGMILWIHDDDGDHVVVGKEGTVARHDSTNKRRHAWFLYINILCFCLHAIAGPRTNWLPSNFAEQAAFGTLIWYDGIYNNHNNPSLLFSRKENAQSSPRRMEAKSN